MPLKKNIILGICGGIAAYKSAELARLLIKQGHVVQVVMTESAKQFIAPHTLQAITGKMVRDSLWDKHAEAAMGHIELARWADTIVIAPATANVLSKLAIGMADDLLTTLCLACKASLFVAPAMNKHMWTSAAVISNCALLRSRGVTFLGPDSGEQACRDVGFGRMMEPFNIVNSLCLVKPLFSGKHFVLTAGPTREPLDPIRYLSNRSSGKMGYAFAKAAIALGASVTLISGPVSLPAPRGVDVVYTDTAAKMYAEVMQRVNNCDVFVAAAAVADYCISEYSQHKIKKTSGDLVITLQRNPDILAAVGKLASRPLIVGFAAETEELIQRAQQKLESKNCDFIIANDVSGSQVMGQDSAAVSLISANFKRDYAAMEKLDLALKILTDVYHQALVSA